MATEGWGKYGTWEETESFLGNVIAVSKGADAVEYGSIRKWLESKQFHPPIHLNKQAAEQAGLPRRGGTAHHGVHLWPASLFQ